MPRPEPRNSARPASGVVWSVNVHIFVHTGVFWWNRFMLTWAAHHNAAPLQLLEEEIVQVRCGWVEVCTGPGTLPLPRLTLSCQQLRDMLEHTSHLLPSSCRILDGSNVGFLFMLGPHTTQ